MSNPGPTWYYAATGDRIGPYTLDEMRRLLADGVVSGETLVWTQGMAVWAPASSFAILLHPPEEDAGEEPPPVMAAPPAPPPVAAAEGSPALLAWRRFFARWFDTITLMALGLAVAGYSTPESLTTLSPLVLLAAPLGALLVQAVFISATGTTPGKALVGLRLRTPEGGVPPFGAALVRELYVWALGMGLGLNFVMPVTHAFAYFRLTRRGATHWDERLGLRMEVAPIGPGRAVILAALLLLFGLAMITGLQYLGAGPG